MTQKSHESTAFFAGSFNPFTRGHLSVVARALAIFDRVVVAIGHNADKPTGDIEQRLSDIQHVFANEPRVDVMAFSGLAVDAAREAGATVMLKGVRSCRDFEYERDMADINRRLSGIETVMLFAEPELGAVSSSVVRDLQKHGADVSEFLP